MSSANNISSAGGSTRTKTYFEQHREVLVGEIAVSFDQVLANINRLNRSLEAVIAVGNEFSAVEALWSQFENVMAKDPDPNRDSNRDSDETRPHGEEETDQTRAA